MNDIRGLSLPTRKGAAIKARWFLNWLSERPKQKDVRQVTGSDVLDFITEFVGLHSSNSWRVHLCCEIRRFLRFLRWEEIIAADLARVVPKVSSYRLSSIPKHLPWDQVVKLIDSVDTSHPEGKRDKAGKRTVQLGVTC